MLIKTIKTIFKATKTGVNVNGSSIRGYKLLSKSPTLIRRKILKPTHITNFFSNSIWVGFRTKNINKPGTMVKNKKLKTGLSTGKSSIMDRSVKRRINNSIARNFLILSLIDSNILYTPEDWKTTISSDTIRNLIYRFYAYSFLIRDFKALKMA